MVWCPAQEVLSKKDSSSLVEGQGDTLAKHLFPDPVGAHQPAAAPVGVHQPAVVPAGAGQTCRRARGLVVTILSRARHAARMTLHGR